MTFNEFVAKIIQTRAWGTQRRGNCSKLRKSAKDKSQITIESRKNKDWLSKDYLGKTEKS